MNVVRIERKGDPIGFASGAGRTTQESESSLPPPNGARCDVGCLGARSVRAASRPRSSQRDSGPSTTPRPRPVTGKLDEETSGLSVPGAPARLCPHHPPRRELVYIPIRSGETPFTWMQALSVTVVPHHHGCGGTLQSVECSGVLVGGPRCPALHISTGVHIPAASALSPLFTRSMTPCRPREYLVHRRGC